MTGISERTSKSPSTISERLAAWIQNLGDNKTNHIDQLLWDFDQKFIRRMEEEYLYTPLAELFGPLAEAMRDSFLDAQRRLEQLDDEHEIWNLEDITSPQLVRHFEDLLQEQPYLTDLRWIVISFHLLGYGHIPHPLGLMEALVEEDPTQIIWMTRAALFSTFLHGDDTAPLFRKYLTRLAKRVWNLSETLADLHLDDDQEISAMAWLTTEVAHGASFFDYHPLLRGIPMV